MANDISITNKTETSLTAKASNLRTGGGTKTITWLLDGDEITWYKIGDSIQSTSYTFTDLQPDTTYTISYIIWYEMLGWSDEYSDTITDTTLEEEEEPEPEEPEPEEQWWDLAFVKTYSNIKETKTGSEYLNECEVLRVDMTFSIGGNIQFETVDASGVRIYLSDSSSLDEESGKPSYTILESDSSKTGDAEFEYNITAGDNYYLFIHHYYKDQYGTINFKITVPEKTRPSKFSWSSPKNAEEEFNLTDNEWNSLCQNVNSLLAYSDKYDYNFTKAVKKEPFMAEMFNEILEAIKPISTRTEEALNSYKVEPGDIIKAKALNDLVALVNEID